MSKSSPKLTVAMIVRDGGQELADTLQSVRPLADELVIVDTGSTDDSRQIAHQYQAKVHPYEWRDDFAAARNEAWQYVTGDWILWLDAGETLDEETIDQLRNHVREDAEPTNAYILTVRAVPGQNQTAAEQVGRIRLVPNGKDIRFAGRIGESLHSSLAAARIDVQWIPGVIHRSATANDPKIKSRRTRRNIRLADADIKQNGPRTRPLIILGEALQDIGMPEPAAEAFRHAISVAEPSSTERLEAYYGLLTTYDQGRDPEAQLNVCLQALEGFPLDVQLLCAMGGYLQTKGQFSLATRSYETAFRYGQLNPETWHLEDVVAIAAVCFSLALQLQKKDEEALEVLNDALSANPTSLRIRRQLMELHVKHGRLDGALAQLELLPAGSPLRRGLEPALRGACLAQQDDWSAAQPLLRQATNENCREAFCLRALVRTCVALSDRDGAENVLKLWQEHDPQNPEIQTYLDGLQNHLQSEKRLDPADPADPIPLTSSSPPGHPQSIRS